MKRLLGLAVFILVPVLALGLLGVQPVTDYLNRQTAIDPTTISSSYNTKLAAAQFHGAVLAVPPYIQNNILGSKPGTKDKRIEVDLAEQKLYMFEDDTKVHDFLVSTGKWGRTPTGEFRIWTKLRYTLMAGGSQALNTYYYLPNVPYTMYFYGSGVDKSRGYGLHGTYWHSNFGHPMSHGCVNMKTEEAKIVFDWATSEQEDETGTKLVIYGTAPTD